MKKFFVLAFVLIFFVVGCSLGNTPTSKVEDLMGKYQRLDSSIKEDIENTINSENLTEEQKKRYRDVLENQYQNLSYEIKDEVIDGDKAVVKVAIEVIDFKKAISDIDRDNNSIESYNDIKLDRLEEAKDKVNYTLDIDVIKDENGNWALDSLSNVSLKKLQGMY